MADGPVRPSKQKGGVLTETLVAHDDEFFRISLREGMLAIIDGRTGYVSWSVDAASGEFGPKITGDTDSTLVDEKGRCITGVAHFQSEPQHHTFLAPEVTAAVVTLDSNMTTEVCYFVLAEMPPLEIKV